MLEHIIPVFRREIDGQQFNAEFIADGPASARSAAAEQYSVVSSSSSQFFINSPSPDNPAVAVNRAGDGGIHTAGHSDDDFFWLLSDMADPRRLVCSGKQ